MIVIFTLGFDVKFQLRSLVKRTKDVEKVVIVGEFNDARAKNALEALVNFLGTINVPHETIGVNLHDFQDMVVKVARYLLSNPEKEFLANLSGGMRSLTLAVLSAFLLTGVDAEVEIETEDFATVYTFRVKDISPLSTPLTKDHIEVLKAIYEGFNSTGSIQQKSWNTVNYNLEKAK